MTGIVPPATLRSFTHIHPRSRKQPYPPHRRAPHTHTLHFSQPTRCASLNPLAQHAHTIHAAPNDQVRSSAPVYYQVRGPDSSQKRVGNARRSALITVSCMSEVRDSHETLRISALARATIGDLRRLQAQGAFDNADPDTHVAASLGLPTGDWTALTDDPFADVATSPTEFDLRVFSQSEVWISLLGQRVEIASMSPSERTEVLEHCFEHATLYWSRRAATQLMGLRVGELKMFDEADVALIAELESHDWLERTPLIISLRSLKAAS